ncbi:putative metal-dependent HD superfamily phosphohydrolase [Luteimonas sp. J16]|nr:putative metal-dependent HD superfamily phosphohydrolase [Luteimonas sp. J16]
MEVVSNAPDLPQGMLDALEAAYARPARAYHHFGHVREVLRHYDEVAAGPGWSQPWEVRLAVLYHDAVYEPGRTDNEARSAAFARAQIARWLPEAGVDVDRVAALIELTARHGQLARRDFEGSPLAADTCHFLDCDMAILGAEPAVFDAYDQAIAAEYRGHVPGWVFRINRRRFLKGLLARPRIFLSDFFHARFDARARANLRRCVTGKR